MFGLIKNNGIDLCNKLKLQATYGSEKAQSQREMGKFSVKHLALQILKHLLPKPKEFRRKPLHKFKNPLDLHI